MRPENWLDSPARWRPLLSRAREAICGLDSETYGHNVRESSPAWRARIDVFSIGVPAWPGGEVYEGFVLPASALWDSEVRGILASGKWVLHNAGHDFHAFGNYGIRIPVYADTLELARLLYPGRSDYTLKGLRTSLLGKERRDTFKELTRPDELITGIRKHKGEVKWTVKQIPVPIESIGETHARFAAKVAYAAEDAVDAPELWHLFAARAAEVRARLPEQPF